MFQFPKQTLVFGPQQVVARINQDQVISPQITLWNQQGSEVIQGTLLVIPIEESLLYVRPLYLRAQQGRIPELTRVIVAYQNSIVMDRSLDAALARLFSPEAIRARRAQPQDAAVVTADTPVPVPGAAGGEPGPAGASGMLSSTPATAAPAAAPAAEKRRHQPVKPVISRPSIRTADHLPAIRTEPHRYPPKRTSKM